MRIAKLKLTNWKNFMQVDLSLQDRLFVVGPNAGGKSNLLDALRFLHDLVVPGGGLITAVRQRGGLGNILPFSLTEEEAQNAQVRIAVCLKISEGCFWDYELVFTKDAKEVFTPVIVSETVSVTQDKVTEQVLARPDANDTQDPERLTQTALEQVGSNAAFRDVAHFFGAIRGTHISPFGTAGSTEDMNHALLGAERRTVGIEFLASVARCPRDDRTKRLLALATTMQMLIPDLERIEWHPNTSRRTCLRVYRKSWSRNSYADETKLSEGSLRLMSFFWAMQEDGGALILEEPESALPPGVLQILVPYAHEAQKSNGCRQLIISTHSPTLMGDTGIAAEEVAIIRTNENDSTGGASVMLASDDPILSEIMQVGLSAAEAVFPIIEDPTAGIELLQTRL